jgi:hypothetical protein
MPITVLSEVNEKQTSYITLTFLDEAGVAITPTSLTWTLNDLITGTNISSGTVSTPTAVYTMEITPTMNAITNQKASREEHVLTITAPYQGTKSVTGDFHFNVVNLEHLT